jgi:hypothetical protein
MVDKSFAVYSGDDATAMALMFCGGAGNISVTANVAPRAMHELCVRPWQGDIARAIDINNRVLPACQAVRRAESGAGQVGTGRDGQDAVRSAPAAGAAGRPFHDTVRAACAHAGLDFARNLTRNLLLDLTFVTIMTKLNNDANPAPARVRCWRHGRSVAACSTAFRIRQGGLQGAKKASSRPLDVPPDLTQLAKDNRYAIPEGSAPPPRRRTSRARSRARQAPSPACRPRRPSRRRSRGRCASSAPAASAGWRSSSPRSSSGRR